MLWRASALADLLSVAGGSAGGASTGFGGAATRGAGRGTSAADMLKVSGGGRGGEGIEGVGRGGGGTDGGE